MRSTVCKGKQMTPALAVFATDRLVHLSRVDLVIVGFYFALVLGIGF